MGVFQYEKVKDPTYYGENRVAAHSDHRYYGSVEEMEQHVENFRHSLNGLWKFHYAKNYESTIPGFETPEYDCTKWDDIRVPAHIQMEGYDAPQYANVQYPWEGREEIQPGEIPERFNPTASYVKYFEVPEQMKGKRLFVSFQGAESGIAVWLNGTFLGYSEDTFTPSEFELTPYLKEGENKLAAQVFKWTSGSWCEDQDFFRFSGIYRDVYLYTIPEVHVSDLKVQTLLDDTFTKADLVIDTKMIGTGKVKITLLKDGTALQSTEGVLDGETQFVLKVDHPELWSAETPVLYDLLLEVTAEDGTVQELIPQRVGFRRFEMKDHIMMLNGKRVVFKGVNRHEFSSVSGRVVSREELIKDLTTMKQNNINAIRTCHYPDAVGIYDLCDEYGLYMIAECNMESHGTRDTDAVRSGDFSGVVPCDRPEWMDCMLDRVNSMYQRDKNHPAILIWSCGNESFGGKVIFEMSQLYRKMDPTRLVHYEGVNDDRRYNDTSDMESRMYAKPWEIREYLESKPEKPFILCEYMHDMGNSLGGMESYVKLAEEYPQYQGGFIWDYMDQAIWHTDVMGRKVLGYGGDFGERTTDYNFSGNGIVYADGAEKPAMQDVRYWYASPADRAAQDAVNAAAAAQADRTLAEAWQSRRTYPLVVTQGDGNLGVKGKNFEVLFSIAGAGPASLKVNGTEWLWRAPRPAFWRASTDNDRGCGFPLRAAAWMAADVFVTYNGMKVLEAGPDCVKVQFQFGIPTVPGASAELVYTVEAQGALRVDAVYHGVAGAPELPCFGVKFETFGPVTRTVWTGLSGETYPDRYKGGVFGCHEETPHVEPHLVPQDCGMHMQTRQAMLEQRDACGHTTAALTLQQVDAPFAFSALPNTAQEIEAAQHITELPATGRTSVMVLGAVRGVGGIDSWGTDVEEPYHVSGEEDHSVSFRIVL